MTSDARQLCRQKRNALTAEQQYQHANKAMRWLMRSRWTQRPKKIALFLAQDGELPTELLFRALWQRHHRTYLPVLQSHRGRSMAFAEVTVATHYQLNQFGILEPKVPHHQHLTGNQLDIVLMPLTCFDHQGNRIGMGGGYYDRTFAFKRRAGAPSNKPKLIGWAHQCQQIDQIQPNAWDIPLDGLITENHLYEF
ncbi:5-formyltetrahydrofolate cyclo-ligase [Hydrogenovibrio sp. SC-1]|uniref:5-formyltetrahydrofolate cyclo-ligase n=1 Tax=Hydrogenovibrio sp. SC-1 TaxID=2065820 RepID=UPI000C7BA3FF|nr:5-formyltetrahydrofolate cyclo-ligase [Hydrogenovibrio sp. SC-1]PLA75467.1 5-formyltetrahydrofolate cyclo-ligase [Hydrogenovibrio sp. SC-1]